MSANFEVRLDTSVRTMIYLCLLMGIELKRFMCLESISECIYSVKYTPHVMTDDRLIHC